MQQVEQDGARKDVDAHRRDKRLFRIEVLFMKQIPWWDAAADFRETGVVGLLFKAGDGAFAIETEDAHARCVVWRGRQSGDRDVRIFVDVGFEQPDVIHAVQMIARENQIVVRVVAQEMAGCLTDGVGRALKPVGVVGCLLGRDDVDEPVRERIHAVGLCDVMVQRCRVELRQDKNPPQVGVQAVADRHVDEAVFPRNRNRRLRALLRQRKQAGSLAAAEDDCEHVVHAAHVPW